ncbi:Hercynine oxygenase (Gamma-glutamyl hercynylcysteine S-oxide synthase) [Durusdinium trenchii]|uniref:Hercynine oxygenase (Gamma-glutamyl hercynylcysteine S-oxide synthase) n=1 Tax=Durusdinium trenchii TaxID=1381693 RepID=A0ABP0SGI5_9DINO
MTSDRHLCRESIFARCGWVGGSAADTRQTQEDGPVQSNCFLYVFGLGEFWHFVAAGGYRTQKYWSEDGWNWRKFRNMKWPFFWVQDGPQGSMQFKLRTIFEEIDMQWSWPADVNYHEARAYCAWKSEQDGLKDQEAYRVITEAEHHLIRHPEARPENMAMARDDPTLSLGGMDFPKVAGTNANLAFASQSPVDAMPASPTGHHDAMGNAWEWTEDHFNPLEGFEVHYTYDDFSTPCFDGRHHMIMGGSFISKSDNGASGFCRYHFRPHFLQHSGFRLVSSNSPPPARLLHEPEEAVQAAQAGQAPSGSAAGTGAAVAGHAGYETQRLVDQYLGLHFPSSGADEVVGIDFSQAFIDAAEKMKNGEVVRVIRFKVPLEGDLEAEVTAEHEANVTAAARQRVTFQTGDACRLKDQVDELGTFDGAVLANLLCRLPEPVACAVLGCLLVTCAQATEIVTPFSWLEDFTPKSKWLGGYLKDNKEVHSKDELQRLMEQRGFSKLSEQKLPLVIREHQRKYQYIARDSVGTIRNRYAPTTSCKATVNRLNRLSCSTSPMGPLVKRVLAFCPPSFSRHSPTLHV